MRHFFPRIIAIFIIALTSFLFVVSSNAQEESRESEVPKEEKPVKKELGRWWLKNARTYNPLPKQWLFHVQGEGGFTRSTGNMGGHTILGGAILVVRKSVFTNYADYKVYRQKIELTDGNSVVFEIQSFEDAFRIDLTSKISGLIGFMWDKDETKYLTHRYIYSVGMMFQLMDNSKHKLSTMGAYGSQNEEFEHDSLVSHDTGILYLSDNYTGIITKSLALEQEAQLFLDMSDSDFYRYIFKIGLDYKLNRQLSIVPQLSVEYNSEPAFEESKKSDVMQRINIRFSF
ncbi:MAG: hypothetical protein B6244_07155 [Candidatus Cloacimonetes bacterium 4572_55]|nr:MAG: hypothetical protein B6244_07155 [Candidatus Cloacimonetes bacterium 4572_55]